MQGFILTVICTVFLMVAPFQAAHAELSIAVVDVQSLLTESKAAKSIQSQVQKEREKLQAEFTGYENKLRESEKKLVETRASMTPEEFNAKREEFQKQLQETGSVVQKKKRALEEALVKANSKLRNEILKIVAKKAEEKKYDFVLTRQNIVLVAKEFDITAEIMEAVNAGVTNIALEIGK